MWEQIFKTFFKKNVGEYFKTQHQKPQLTKKIDKFDYIKIKSFCKSKDTFKKCHRLQVFVT